MQSISAKLYPHKLLSNTTKCLLAAKVYDVQVELSNDFNYLHELDNEKRILSFKKPLLIYGTKSICTTKAICFFFHRLKNEKNKQQEEKLNFYLQWINWCESLEECIELLNKKKIIESLNELDLFLKTNKEKNKIFINADKHEEDKLSLADVFVYVSLKHCEIKLCEKSWEFISYYLTRVHESKIVQDVMENIYKLYKYKSVYNLYISKLEETNINDYIKKENFYITTAINYVNGNPHIGHAYEIVVADVIARYNRNLGRDTYFTTGADEHGIKIANQAKKNNITPIELCNKYVFMFQELNRLLKTSEDYYVRTTNKSHSSIVQKLWVELEKKGDIYLGEYEGWYNIREETYVPENEAKLMNYIDPTTNIKLEKMKEPSYFFKMNKYQQQLIEHINKNPDFILPEQKKNEILQRLKEPLIDLSCSRINFSWGIPVPNNSEHVMYVWMDALLNYYTNCFVESENKKREHFWPANVHIIGKDIIWFHAVIFPIILIASNLPLPKHVFSHGFVLATDGKKMSKSFGNVIDPFKVIEQYGADAFRYHIVKETKYGTDVRFDIDNLIDMCNSDLADILGNLVHRILALCMATNDSKVPPYYEEFKNSIKVPFNVLHFINKIEFLMKSFQIQQACDQTMNVCKDLNKYLTELEPWKLKEHEKNKKMHIIRIMLESIYFITHYLDIFIPTIASHIFKKLNTEKRNIVDLSVWLNNLQEGCVVNNEGVIFKKFDVVSATIKMQKVVLKVCKIIDFVKTEEGEKKYTLCNIQVEGEETITALLNLPANENYLSTLTLALTNMKPTTVNNISVCAIIPHINNNIFVFSEDDESCKIGTLINAKDYPLLAKKRDNLTKKEIIALNISVEQNRCMFDKNIPLIFSSTGKPLCHSSVPTGCFKFF